MPQREGRGFGTIMPDLVVEVISPSDTEDNVADKTSDWISAGVRCVVNVYPGTQSASVFRLDGGESHYQHDQTADLRDIVDGWMPIMSSFFGSGE